MNCEEFLVQFREALEGKVPEQIIQDNVDYYRNYIIGQTRNGKSEADVIRMLGEPRLLAKTIEESNKFAASGGSETYDGFRSTRNTVDREYDKTSKIKSLKLPGWLVACIVMAIVFFAVVVVFKIFVFFLPVIAVTVIAGIVYKTLKNGRNG